MLTASFTRDGSGQIVKFLAEGHTGYAEAGADIVCAAVSALSLYVINTLTDVVGMTVGYEARDACCECVLPAEMTDGQRRVAQVLLEGFLQAARGLEQQYHAYMTVKELEV